MLRVENNSCLHCVILMSLGSWRWFRAIWANFEGSKPPERKIRLNGSKPPPGNQRHQNNNKAFNYGFI